MEMKEQIELLNLNDSVNDKLILVPYSQDEMSNHVHNFFELVYITGGKCIHTLNETEMCLKKGDYFIVDYGSKHGYRECKDLTLINCLFLPESVDDTLKDCRSFEKFMRGCLMRYHNVYIGESTVNHIFEDDDLRVQSLIEGMLREFQNKSVGYTEVNKCRLIEIMIITMRKVSEGIPFLSKQTIILDLIEFIHKNYKEKNIVHRFCESHHYTTQYISRKFKKETHQTIMQYIQRVRIEKSLEILASSDLAIPKVAELVGYDDIKFFNQIFKRIVKMTPREYRKENL